MDDLDAKIGSLFNGYVSVGISNPGPLAGSLWPEENEAIKNAVPSRKREFAAGRTAARKALAGFGAPLSAIPMLPDRCPKWPAGYVGSISHCDGLCAAVVGERGAFVSLGFDAEVARALPSGVSEMIYNTEEVQHFSSLPAVSKAGWGTVAFSIKEAFYKGLYQLQHQYIDFLEVVVSFEMDASKLAGDVLIKPRHSDILPTGLIARGRWSVTDTIVLTGVSIQRD